MRASLPSRERGLKSHLSVVIVSLFVVAPFAGAWIEINLRLVGSDLNCRRSLRGSVD